LRQLDPGGIIEAQGPHELVSRQHRKPRYCRFRRPYTGSTTDDFPEELQVINTAVTKQEIPC